MRYLLFIMFFCNNLFTEAKEEKNFTNTNIVDVYKQIKNSFSDSYYLPQDIKHMKNIIQAFNDGEREIYGYKNLKVQWQNMDEVTINLNAFDNGKKICTHRSYDIHLKQIGKNVHSIVKSKMLYPQDIDSFVNKACECNYYRGEVPYNKTRKKEIDKNIKIFCKPLSQMRRVLQEKYKNDQRLEIVIDKADKL